MDLPNSNFYCKGVKLINIRFFTNHNIIVGSIVIKL